MPITVTLMHNRIRNRAETQLGILRGNLKYQKLGFTAYPGFGLPIKDLDTCHASSIKINGRVIQAIRTHD